MRVSIGLHLKPFLSQVNWLQHFSLDGSDLGTTVILRALPCLDIGPETGGFSHVLGVVDFISIIMY